MTNRPNRGAPTGRERRRPWSPGIVIAAGIALVLVLGALDLLSGPELSFSVFYLAPVSVVAWYGGRTSGIVLSVLAAATWMAADRAAGATYSAAWIPVWNAGVRLGFFVIVTELLARLGRALTREQQLATTDHLTGVVNPRAFYATAEAELQRMRRHPRPVTLAYADLDNFKSVNDRYGHEAGDRLLRLVAEAIRTNVRVTDTVARLGGDEFAILMPETDAEAARAAIDKVHRIVLAEIRDWSLPVSVSIGVATCLRAPASVDGLVRLSDDLMYAVKHGSKDAVRYATYDAEALTPADGHSATVANPPAGGPPSG